MTRHVVHVVGGLGYGGVERWLVEVCRRSGRDRFHWTFVVSESGPRDLEPELVAMGCDVVVTRDPRNLLGYAIDMWQILRRIGRVDVVHAHMQHFSVVALGIAWLARVPGRFFHAHANSAYMPGASGFVRRIYERIAAAGLLVFTTRRLAVTDDAGRSVFGRRWARDDSFVVLPAGIDVSSLRQLGRQRTGLRNALFPGEPGPILGQVARLDPVKNHEFTLRLFVSVKAAYPTARLILVGEGPSRAIVEELVREHGLATSVSILGARADAAQLIASMDVVLLPSLAEGLPLVALESQAIGTPIVISDRVPRDAIVLPRMVSVAALNDVPAWMATVDQVLTERTIVPTASATNASDAWGVADLANGAAELWRMYDDVVTGPRAALGHHKEV